MADPNTAFRDCKVLVESMQQIAGSWKCSGDIGVTDRTLIWNSDLIETLEYDNLIAQVAVTLVSAADDASRAVRIDYRTVHTYTMSQEVQYIPPKARVY